MCSWDPTEPFYTSAGKAAWNNGNCIGECGDQGPINSGASGHFDMTFWPGERGASNIHGRAISGIGGDALRGCTDTTSTAGSRIPTIYCMIVGSYQVRPDDVADLTWSSWRLDDIPGKAIGSDALWGFWMRNYRYANVYNGSSLVQVYYNTPQLLQHAYWTSNHDAAYNVLFTDGSVKTFSDAGMSLFKDMQRTQLSQSSPGDGLSLEQLGGVYTRYFDGLYAQD